MKTLNITIISQMMGIFFGGEESVALSIAQTLRKRGHNLRLIIGKTYKKITPLPEEVLTFDVQFVFSPYTSTSWISNNLGNSNKLKWFLSSLVNHFKYRMFELAVYKKLRGDNWSDVYYICGGLVILASFLNRKKPTIISWPGLPSRMARKMLNNYSKNIAGGDIYPKIKKWCNNAEYVEVGLDSNYFKPPKKKPSKENIDFLFVGRLVKVKNLSYLVKGFYESLKENKKMFLHIVGEGQERNNLETLAEKLNITDFIKFYGVLYKENLLKIYQNSDVFIITSEYESFSMVTTEAMACGLPVIGTNVGFLPNLIKDGERGFLVELNNINELKEKILFFSKNREKVREFGSKARNFVEKNFSWEERAKRIENIYYEVVNRNK
jgi:glycosyltransferase involved in cell wall biosynthesis